MISFDQYIQKYNNKGIDVDGFPKNNPYQCMDNYRQYVKEVLGFPQSPPVKGAKDVWDTYLRDYFIRYSNTPLGIPQKGDIMIWGSGYGPFGHIGMVTEAHLMWFNSFDQNDPIGTLCHIQRHSYRGVLGWLRPKDLKPSDDVKINLIRTVINDPGSATEKVNKIKIIVNG